MRHLGLFLALLLCSCSAGPGLGDDAQPQDDGGTLDDATQPNDATQSSDGSQQSSDSSTSNILTSPNVQIIVEPNGNGGSEVVNAINAATKSVHMTMYILSSTDVITALIARHKAGVDVKVLLDSSTQTSNGSVYTQLKNAGVSVAWSSTKFTFTHEKCVIIDGKVAWIMTMNLTQTSPTSNREYLAIDTTPGDVTEAETIFAGDFANNPPTSVTGALVVAPINALSIVTGLIAESKSTIDIEAEELSDYHTADALKAALARGVKVRVVLSNATMTTNGQAAVAEIKGAGGKLVEVSTPYIHAKTMVIDGTTAFVGSENFSEGSLLYNRELGVVFTVASEISKIEATISSDFAKGTAL